MQARVFLSLSSGLIIFCMLFMYWCSFTPGRFVVCTQLIPRLRNSMDVTDLRLRNEGTDVIDLRFRNEKIPQLKLMQVPTFQIKLLAPLASGDEVSSCYFLKMQVG